MEIELKIPVRCREDDAISERRRSPACGGRARGSAKTRACAPCSGSSAST